MPRAVKEMDKFKKNYYFNYNRYNYSRKSYYYEYRGNTLRPCTGNYYLHKYELYAKIWWIWKTVVDKIRNCLPIKYKGYSVKMHKINKINEIIIVTYCTIDTKYTKNMLRNVNRSVVAKQEVLGNNVYRFDGELSMV